MMKYIFSGILLALPTFSHANDGAYYCKGTFTSLIILPISLYTRT